MTALRRWRQRFGIEAGLAAAVCGITPELFERIELGQVEPEPELAFRIYIVSAGHVPLSTWESVRLRIIADGLKLRACAAAHPIGGFGVNLYLGSELVALLTTGAALELAGEIRNAADTAANPPDPLPVIPWPEEEGVSA